MKLFSKIKKRWTAYLEKMAAANEKQYGQERLDCCDLNGSKKTEHTSHS